MSGYSRTGAAVRKIEVVVDLIPQSEIVRVKREHSDPFGLAFHCLNPAGHQPTASCGEIVCVHCARVFWR